MKTKELKPFNFNANTMYEGLGVSEERAAMFTQYSQIYLDTLSEAEGEINMSHMLGSLAKHCETPNELLFVGYSVGINLCHIYGSENIIGENK